MAEGPDCRGASVLSARGPTRPQGSGHTQICRPPRRPVCSQSSGPGAQRRGMREKREAWGRPLLPQARHGFHPGLRLRPVLVMFPVFLSLPCGKNSLRRFSTVSF